MTRPHVQTHIRTPSSSPRLALANSFPSHSLSYPETLLRHGSITSGDAHERFHVLRCHSDETISYCAPATISDAVVWGIWRRMACLTDRLAPLRSRAYQSTTVADNCLQSAIKRRKVGRQLWLKRRPLGQAINRMKGLHHPSQIYAWALILSTECTCHDVSKKEWVLWVPA